MVLSALFVFPALSRDLHLRLSKALVILTASDLFKRQEEIPHLRAGRQKETSALFQTGELVSLEDFFCEYICASAEAMTCCYKYNLKKRPAS
jgi:hypothetical protein